MLDAAASQLPAGAEGLVTVPHWWGCRFPDARPHLKGATIGWSNHHTKNHLYFLLPICRSKHQACRYRCVYN